MLLEPPLLQDLLKEILSMPLELIKIQNYKYNTLMVRLSGPILSLFVLGPALLKSPIIRTKLSLFPIF